LKQLIILFQLHFAFPVIFWPGFVATACIPSENGGKLALELEFSLEVLQSPNEFEPNADIPFYYVTQQVLFRLSFSSPTR